MDSRSTDWRLPVIAVGSLLMLISALWALYWLLGLLAWGRVSPYLAQPDDSPPLTTQPQVVD